MEVEGRGRDVVCLRRYLHNTVVRYSRGPSQARCRSEHTDNDNLIHANGQLTYASQRRKHPYHNSMCRGIVPAPSHAESYRVGYRNLPRYALESLKDLHHLFSSPLSALSHTYVSIRNRGYGDGSGSVGVRMLPSV